MKNITLDFVSVLKDTIKSEPAFIQIILGPRQVGKTTGVIQLKSMFEEGEISLQSADGEISRSADWLTQKWVEAKSTSNIRALVIDEIQNIELWSTEVKKLWDEQKLEKHKMHLILLGSSSLSIQKGLNESLAGRFQLHTVSHWSYPNSHKAYGISWDEYLLYGGYPGAYPLIKKREDWLQYMKASIIDTVIGKDILNLVRVKSPALFKQCFEIAMQYAGQEISYTKLLGQLQDKGNTDLIKNYLENFEGAFLLKQIFKYSNKAVIRKSSSPKILAYCPALYSVFLDADLNAEEKGRSFEVIVGSHLSQLPGELYYWRERNYEVDYIYKYGKKLFAIEVKSGSIKKVSGLKKFKEKFPEAKLLIITPDNFLEIDKLMGIED